MILPICLRSIGGSSNYRKTGDKREPEERMNPGENESWEREAYWGSNCYPLDLSGRSVLDDRP